MEGKKSILSRALSIVAGKSASVTNTEGPRQSNLAAVQQAVEKSTAIVTAAAENNRKGICFVIDATGSRQHSWEEAQKIQASMFEALKATENMNIGIICHRGQQVEHLGWFNNADSAKNAMRKIDCVGGNTRIVASLQKALDGRERTPSSVMLVGDAFEEDIEQLSKAVAVLKSKGVKVYAFLEGNDPAAEQAFRLAARVTDGVFKKFGDRLDGSLTDLCVAAAVFDTGGKPAFDRLLAAGHAGAKLLASDVKRLSGPKPGR